MTGRTAPQKAQLKQWGKLVKAKGRREEGLFLAEGGKVVGELLRSGRPAGGPPGSAGRAAAGGRSSWPGCRPGVRIFRLTDREWGALSQDPAPEGVMAVAAAPPPVDPAPACRTETGTASSPPSGEQSQQPGRPSPDGALVRLPDGSRQRGFLRGDEPQGGPDVDGEPLPPDGDRRSRFREHSCREIRGRFRVVGSEVREGVAPHPCAAGDGAPDGEREPRPAGGAPRADRRAVADPRRGRGGVPEPPAGGGDHDVRMRAEEQAVEKRPSAAFPSS